MVSIICSICWTLRGTYLILTLYKNDKIGTFKFGLKSQRVFETLFYLFLEWPPSIVSLLLMLRQPNSIKQQNKNSQHEIINNAINDSDPARIINYNSNNTINQSGSNNIYSNMSNNIDSNSRRSNNFSSYNNNTSNNNINVGNNF